mgnify:CR=1 FL=1
MTKKTTTKKSGTIAYQLRRQNDLTGTATEKNPQMAVTVVNSKLTTTKELKELLRSGKLRAMGSKNVRFYVKGSL